MQSTKPVASCCKASIILKARAIIVHHTVVPCATLSWVGTVLKHKKKRLRGPKGIVQTIQSHKIQLIAYELHLGLAGVHPKKAVLR